eukprot:scaffold36306_cov73-Cyclotella_meneghiniana.AAC.6
MISSLRLLTKAIKNIATNGSLVDHFWNKHLNNILDLLSVLIHHCLTPGTSAVYLPDNIVVECSSIVLHSDLDGSLQ